MFNKKNENKTRNENKKERLDDSEAGWTFIETLIVIGIILILTSSVGFMAVKYLDKARTVTAKSQIETFSLALDAYFLDCLSYPAGDLGLAALWTQPAGVAGWNGPYISKPLPKDPWGNDYGYEVPGENGMPFRICSLGADGQAGGNGNDADIATGE